MSPGRPDRLAVRHPARPATLARRGALAAGLPSHWARLAGGPP